LIQGSVQPPVPLARSDWEKAMRSVAEKQFAVKWTDWEPDAELRGHAETLAREKFSQPAYNQKR